MINVEPYFLLQFEPSLTNGDPDSTGRQLYINLGGVETPVDSIQLSIRGTQHQLSLSYAGEDVLTVDDVYVKEFRVNNFVIDKDMSPGATLSLTATNNTQYGYDINSPLCDLFRESDIVRISMIAPKNGSTGGGTATNLFVGSINVVEYDYDSDGLSIEINIEGLLNILSRSATVQTSTDQSTNQVFLNPLTAKEYNFNDIPI